MGDAFGAMLLAAACHTYAEPVPPTVEKGWDFGHPLIVRLAEDQERIWSLFRAPSGGSRSQTAFSSGSRPSGDTAAISTVGGLRKELEKLNQLAWRADEDTILSWTKTEGYPVDGAVGPEKSGSSAGRTSRSTPSTTRTPWPSSPSPCSWQAMRFAEEQQVPILLDY